MIVVSGCVPFNPIMGITRKFFLINLGIIFFNVIFSMLVHLGLLTYRSPVRERYVQLSDRILINDPQLPNEVRDTDPFFSSNETNWGGAICQNYTDLRSLTLNPNRGLLDKTRSFKIHSYTVTGDNWSETSNAWHVCLSTQTSVDLMFWIKMQAEMWEGPLSLALFTPDVDYTIAVKMIKYLQTCFPEVQSRVTFHMVYPRDLPPKYIQIEDDNLEYDCSQPESVNKEILKKIRTPKLQEYMKKSPYPQNLLRNIAREGCHSEYSFTPDVDMISIPGISKQLDSFVTRNSTRNCSKCAFIIPTYEIHSRMTKNPRNKRELKSLLRKRRAQRFHVRVFSPNQANSKLQFWETKPMTEKLNVLYNITSWQNYWEPIYVAKATVPFYDERFVGYGFTRNSQVFEMHLSDYTWHMLNNAFLCHRGFQVNKKKDVTRREQIKTNSELYKAFRREIYARYGKNAEDYEPKKKEKKKKSKTKMEEEGGGGGVGGGGGGEKGVSSPTAQQSGGSSPPNAFQVVVESLTPGGNPQGPEPRVLTKIREALQKLKL